MPPHGFQRTRQRHLLQSAAAISQPVRNMADAFLQHHPAQMKALEKNIPSIPPAASFHPNPLHPALGKGQIPHLLHTRQKPNLPQSLTPIKGQIPQRHQAVRKTHLPQSQAAVKSLLPDGAEILPQVELFQPAAAFKSLLPHLPKPLRQRSPKQLHTIFKSPGAQIPQTCRKIDCLQHKAVPESARPNGFHGIRENHPVHPLISGKSLLRDAHHPLGHHHPGLLPQIFQQNGTAEKEIPQNLLSDSPHQRRNILPGKPRNPLYPKGRALRHPHFPQGAAILEPVLVNHNPLPPEGNGLQTDTIAESPALNLLQGGGKLHGNDAPFVKKGALPNLFNPFRNLHMLQVRQEFCQAPPLQLHHPQHVHRNGAHQAGNRHLPGHHLHGVGKYEPPPVRKGHLRNPAAAREHIAETAFPQPGGNLQLS